MLCFLVKGWRRGTNDGKDVTSVGAGFESCSRVGECKNAAKYLLSAMPKKRSPCGQTTAWSARLLKGVSGQPLHLAYANSMTCFRRG